MGKHKGISEATGGGVRSEVLESGETVGDDAQSPSAFVFNCSNSALNHRQAPILSQSTESMPNPVATTPPLEPPLSELSALVGDEVVGDIARSSERSFE